MLRIGDFITQWLKDYAFRAKSQGFVVGISGGIDSAVTSTLCARTGLQVKVLTMPIRQASAEVDRAKKHIDWLRLNYPNVSSADIHLTHTFDEFEKTIRLHYPDFGEDAYFLAMANSRSRLRMITLYAVASLHGLLVAGTGNKIEDFGVGFYTKYGDGGVDISPIADLMKSEVYALGRELGLIEDILQAKPTDGLWADGRTDEDQIGATYDELEWAMNYLAQYKQNELSADLSLRQKEVLEIYLQRHRANQHKMQAIPVCIIPDDVRN
jgi:NAD+ synthase